MPAADTRVIDFSDLGIGEDIALSGVAGHDGLPLVPPEAEADYAAALDAWRDRVAMGLAYNGACLMLAREGGAWRAVVADYVRKRAACDAVRAMDPLARAARYAGADAWPLPVGVHLTAVTSDGLVPATLRPASMLVGGGTAVLSCAEGLEPGDVVGRTLRAAAAARRALAEELGLAPAERPGRPAVRVLGTLVHLGLAEVAVVAVADLRRAAEPVPYASVAAARRPGRWEPEEMRALPLHDALEGRAAALGAPLNGHSAAALGMVRAYEEAARAREVA